MHKRYKKNKINYTKKSRTILILLCIVFLSVPLSFSKYTSTIIDNLSLSIRKPEYDVVYNANFFPEGFKEVEFIESTGTQYIDTGYIPKTNTKLELTLSFSGDFIPSNNNEESQSIFFSSANTQDDFFGLNFGGHANQYNTLFAWSDKSYFVTGIAESFNITDNIKTNKNTIIMENGKISYGTAGRTITSKSKDQTTSMILFGDSNYGGTPIPMKAYNMKVYRLKLYENDVLVREYVPCYRVSDNEIGLYELINDVFYPNNGTGIFNKGNDIATSGSMANQHFVYGVAQNINNNEYSRAGYTFNGWNTKKNGTGTSYEEGQSVSKLSETDNGIVNLYSQWIFTGNIIIDDEVHLADGEWNEDEGINTPKLVNGLIPVSFNNDGSVNELTSNDYEDWYDYSNKEYANAITKDQNGRITGYWVWVPRYEYIVNSGTQSFTVKFIPVEQTVEDEGYDHIHPAFRDGSSTHYMNGEWDSELPGFWVAKFPAGFQQNTITDSNGTLSTTLSNDEDTLVLSNKNYTSVYGDSMTVPIGTIDNTTKMSLPVFIPLAYTYNSICAGDSYTLAQEISKSSNFYGLDANTNSHMLKNSEWGAIAYLAQSQYGRNGTEISLNNYYTTFQEEPYREAVTGVYAEGSEYWMTDILGDVTPWYTQIGQLGSSTGNITGIYDLNGCAGERIAGYISNGSYSLGMNKGESNWISTPTTANPNGYLTNSTKYYTVYPYDINNDTDTGNWSNYNSLKSSTYGYGDAILETSTTGTGCNAWFVATSTFFEADYPFMERGGTMGAGINSGEFYYEEGPGMGCSGVNFRVILCP